MVGGCRGVGREVAQKGLGQKGRSKLQKSPCCEFKLCSLKPKYAAKGLKSVTPEQASWPACLSDCLQVEALACLSADACFRSSRKGSE